MTKREVTVLERVVVAISKAFIALAAGAGVWSFLALNSFACCGIGLNSHLDPVVSPFGYWPTIALVWPGMGLLCILGQGVVEGLVGGIRFIVRRIRLV